MTSFCHDKHKLPLRRSEGPATAEDHLADAHEATIGALKRRIAELELEAKLAKAREAALEQRVEMLKGDRIDGPCEKRTTIWEKSEAFERQFANYMLEGMFNFLFSAIVFAVGLMEFTK